MLPEHANAWGKIHGGLIMKMVDEAGGIAAMRHSHMPSVTIAMDDMTFLSPVHVGDVLCCSAVVTWVGRTAMEVSVEVHAENPISGAITHTNSAYLVYVALGGDGRPAEVPALDVQSDDERERFSAGAARQAGRVKK